MSAPMLWGPRPTAPGITRFPLWAPDCDAVALEIEGQPALAMTRAPDGWFVAEAPIGPGARYRFRIAPDLAIPDPASRRQAVDVHGFSVVTAPTEFAWQHRDWRGRPWHEAVFYEVHVGAMGGFAGVEQALPRLRDLGVTAIELMPVAAFPGQRNWGYDGVLPFAPHPGYGTPEALKRLVDAAHGLGLMIILDVVYNHFGPDGAYLHTCAKRFFDPARQTGWGEAIAFSEPAVAAYFEENARYWLDEFRFDGLRFDAVHAIEPEAWLRSLPAKLRATCPGRHIHLILENEHNAARLLRPDAASDGFDAQWNDDGHNALHAMLTDENESYYAPFAEHASTKVARALAEGFVFQGPPAARGEPSAHLPPTAFVLFLQNHDQIGNRAFGERLTQLAPPGALAAATALLLLAPQIPLLFMGEEWGATSPFLFFTDHNAELAPLVREGRRREFARFAAFSDPKIRDRIPDPNAEASFTASIPNPAEADGPPHREILALHRHLLAIRHREIMPRLQGTRALGAEATGPASVLARWSLGDGALLTIAMNCGAQVVPCRAAGTLLFETSPGATAALAGGHLPGFCTVALLEQAP
ncbi:malto-oligosyltrehalose trehalohydrolase [Roseomonas hellenica]|uniref:Malto-oligosyltrehalose trehalohydrolase n=1 Tax=Plastoroseomonas hellenica TaxID=2687306 RepID=A0ABS5ERH6_9PROT|nr:malto-oligosyltrehalose trehalohydrolase [Plastoroseomonas hellenica]MBR0662896.1 malto-oligosyltrehalose trehalohydrolase [Plastoroseomonas hellenica]